MAFIKSQMWNMTSDSVFLRKITLFLEKQMNTNIKLPISLGLSRIVFGALFEGEYKKSFSHEILRRKQWYICFYTGNCFHSYLLILTGMK